MTEWCLGGEMDPDAVARAHRAAAPLLPEMCWSVPQRLPRASSRRDVPYVVRYLVVAGAVVAALVTDLQADTLDLQVWEGDAWVVLQTLPWADMTVSVARRALERLWLARQKGEMS